MSVYRTCLNHFLILSFLVLLFLLFPIASFAQTAPELFITWQAKNFTPAGYLGKTLPIRKTVIDAALELIDGGRLIDLRNKEIRWFVNGGFHKSGLGLKTTSFTVSELSGDDQALTAQIINYRGKDRRKTVVVPLAKPELIIDTPSQNKFVAAGLNNFRALPYFFNIRQLRQLSFVWKVNEQSTSGNVQDPDLLELEIAGGEPGTEISLTVHATNKLDPLEAARELINLEIK